MAAETLNFGPEWLRALSSGGSVASPPPSPAMPKYKLADYRYGREEMLALYVKENKVPEELQDKEFAAVLQEEPLQPLALEPLTEEEQRNFSLSVNSVAVLRLMGKGAGPPLPATSRGRGSTRSRGRGRGDSCFYQRSIEEGDGAFGRNPREIQRSQSWDDRGERRFEKPARRDIFVQCSVYSTCLNSYYSHVLFCITDEKVPILCKLQGEFCFALFSFWNQQGGAK